jgi:hypothetical protein
VPESEAADKYFQNTVVAPVEFSGNLLMQVATCFCTQIMCKVLAQFSDYNGSELSHKK